MFCFDELSEERFHTKVGFSLFDVVVFDLSLNIEAAADDDVDAEASRYEGEWQYLSVEDFVGDGDDHE